MEIKYIGPTEFPDLTKYGYVQPVNSLETRVKTLESYDSDNAIHALAFRISQLETRIAELQELARIII